MTPSYDEVLAAIQRDGKDDTREQMIKRVAANMNGLAQILERENAALRTVLQRIQNRADLRHDDNPVRECAHIAAECRAALALKDPK